MKRHRIAAFTLLLSTIAPSAMAATITWTGSTSSDWQEATNWGGGVVPGNIDTAIINIPDGPVVDGIAVPAVSLLRVGDDAHGTLAIRNGGAVTSTSHARVGFAAGSQGTISVVGAGSLWRVEAALEVGYRGSGQLLVQDGANAHGVTYISLGHLAGSSGTATITGAGSSFTTDGYIYIGREGTGILNIEDGASISSATGNSLRIGQLAGGTGTAKVTGAGSTLTTGGELRVGEDGTGTLVIENGGTVESGGHVSIGFNAGSTGTANIYGSGSIFRSNAQIHIGRQGNGSLNVDDGGSVFASNQIYVGSMSGSTGTLTITDGGTVSNANGQTITISNNVGGTGTATVSGIGSTLNSGGLLHVGGFGTGALIVSNGGEVSSTDYTSIGSNASSIGTATVTGADSLLKAGGDFYVGRGGSGTLSVSNGGTVQSTGTLRIAANNGSTGTLNIGTAAGDAAVAAGMIDAANIQFGAGTGRIVFNHTDTNYALASNISGAGTLDVLSGTTILTGNNNGFTGPVNVNGGVLRVNGVMGALSTTVDNGARFEGNATVGALTVNAGGTLAPGNSIGVVNAHDTTFSSASLYEVELNAAGQSDLLADTGTVTINGGTVRVIPYPDYTLGTPYTIITATGGVTGSGFDGLTSALPFLTGNIVYNPNDVQLILSATPDTLASAARTWNQRGVARTAANISGNAAIQALLFSPDAQTARQAMDQLSGEIHASLASAQIRGQETLRAMALKRKPDEQADSGRSSIWVQALGSFGRSGGDRNAATLDTVSGGVMVGMEGGSEEGYFGAGIGHSVQRIDIDARKSDATARSYHALVYGGGTLAETGVEIDGGASFTWHENETSRDVRIGNFSGTSKADYAAQSAQLFAKVGYRLDAGKATVKPYAEGASVHHRTERYREDGVAGLTGRGTNNNAGFATLGIESERRFLLNDDGARILLTGGIGWRHMIGGKDVEQRQSWNDAAGSDFTVRGVPLERDSLIFDMGLSADLAPGVTANVTYAGSLAEDSAYHAVSARAGIKF